MTVALVLLAAAYGILLPGVPGAADASAAGVWYLPSAAGLVLIGLGVRSMRRPGVVRRCGPVELGVAAMAASASPGLVFAGHPPHVMRGLVLMLAWAVLVGSSRRLAADPRSRRTFLRGLAGLGLLVSLYVLGSTWPATARLLGACSGFLLFDGLGNRNHTALFLGMSLMLTMIPIVEPNLRRDRRTLPWLGATLLQAAAVAKLGSAAVGIGILACVVTWVLVYIPLLQRQQPLRGPRAGFVIGLAGIILAGGMVFLSSLDRHGQVRGWNGLGDPSLSARMLLAQNGEQRGMDWWTAWDMFRREPWRGVGLNHYSTAWPEARERYTLWREGTTGYPETAGRPSWPRSTRAHQEFLQWIAETGVPGLLGFLTATGLLIVGLRRSGRTERPWSVSSDRLLLSAASLFVVGSIFSFPTHVPATALLAAVTAGFLTAGVDVGPRFRPARVSGIALLLASGLILAVSAREIAAEVVHGRGEEARRLGRPEVASSQFDRAIQLSVWPDKELASAAIMLSERNPAAALQALTRAWGVSPAFEVRIKQVESLRALGRFAEADLLLDRLDRCEPLADIGDAALFNRAGIRVGMGEFAEAEEWIRRLEATGRHPSRVLLLRAVAAEQAGRRDAAVAAYEALCRHHAARGDMSGVARRRAETETAFAREALLRLRGTPDS